MATEILWPQDILFDRFRRRRSNFGNRNNYFNHRPLTNQISEKFENMKKKKKSTFTRRSANSVDLRPMVMGRVTILRRGESLDSLNSITSGSDQPGMVRLGLPADVYAGSAFSNSPSPRALPLPSFFNNDKKLQDFKSSDDLATKDLRQLLRLEY